MNTTYQPMTLVKHRDGHRYGVVTSNLTGEPVEYRVKVEARKDMGVTYYHISVVGGDIKVYVEAGQISRRGSSMTLRSRDSDGSMSRGYQEQGTLASNVERVVHEHLNSLDYARRQAAKSPEQLAAEAQAIREGRNGAFNDRLAKGAEALLAEIDLLVPSSTAHYAVEGARQALATLIREANKSSIQTTALQGL